MVAYLHKTTGGGYKLTICAKPCNGAEFRNGEQIAVAGKREARAICTTRNIEPWLNSGSA